MYGNIRRTETGPEKLKETLMDRTLLSFVLLTCSWVTGTSLCLASSLITLRSVLRSILQPTSTTLAPGQNSCVSPCHCVEKKA